MLKTLKTIMPLVWGYDDDVYRGSRTPGPLLTLRYSPHVTPISPSLTLITAVVFSRRPLLATRRVQSSNNLDEERS